MRGLIRWYLLPAVAIAASLFASRTLSNRARALQAPPIVAAPPPRSTHAIAPPKPGTAPRLTWTLDLPWRPDRLEPACSGQLCVSHNLGYPGDGRLWVVDLANGALIRDLSRLDP